MHWPVMSHWKYESLDTLKIEHSEVSHVKREIISFTKHCSDYYTPPASYVHYVDHTNGVIS